GVLYQQGALAGYEVREYLPEKWGRKCAYCGAQNLPLQIEHLIPKERGGSNRISNLTLACADLHIAEGSVLLIEAKGHGSRQMARTNKYGFPIRHLRRQKLWFGFRTGDLVRAVIPTGKYAGVLEGRVTVRSRASFRLKGIDVHPKHLTLVQRADGYSYA